MLKEGSGAIVKVNITADESAGGDMTAYVNNILIAASGGSGGVTGGKALTNATFTITVAGKPTVTADGKTRKYGEENPELTYTVSEGTITGTPTLSTTATQESAVGDYPITVTPSNDYNVVNGTLTVTKAPLTISGGTYTMKQGEALPTFTAEYTGFKNNETSSVLTSQPILTLAEGVTGASEPGNYDITVAGATADNYEITFQKGTLTISEANPVTVTAKSYTIKYGEAMPNFEFTSQGATLEGVPTLSCEATVTSSVGEYPIVISKGSVTNYNDTYVNGTLAITKAPLTIKAGTYTKKQGEALPTFEATYEGFKNSETSEVLTKLPVLACEATAASAPGEYAVTVSGAEAQNYEISYVVGKLTVTNADPVTVTAKSYTIKYGEAMPNFEFTSQGATLEGVPTLSCEATVTSSVGEYPIVISKGSVTNYNDTYVNGTLTITKAPLTIKAGTYTKKQGEALPTFTATYEGFKNNETADVLTTKPILATTATSGSEPGEYEVTVGGAEAQNYEISYVVGKLTVTNADPVTVTAKSYTIKYGEALPNFDFTSQGATLEGVPTLSCEATVTSPVGEYPIVISKGSVTNYNDTYVNGTLTITKAPLTIKAGTYTKKQGEALPTFTATYEGFKNDETADVLSTKPTLATTATSASEPGEYEVTVSGAEAQNYEISYVPGTLTVTAADAVTVTAKNYTIKYGDALPDFEFTSQGATLEGVPTLSCEATATSPVGEYPIVISKGSVTNYNDTYVNGTLTITKAPLTIKAGSYTMKQGQALPTFTATYEGFKNDETADVLTTKPTLATTATSASELGEYEVTVSGAEAENYEISYVVGTLKVELLKGDVTGDGFVTADDVTALVNYILGLGTLVNKAAAYVNDDDKIDIADVAALITLVGKQ